MTKRLLLLLSLLTAAALAQGNAVLIPFGAITPSGACPIIALATTTNSSGQFYYCNPSTLVWTLAAGGGGAPGTVTSITATAPIVVTPSPLTTTGVASCLAASGSQAGCLSSTDWTTFNNKQTALTNPVTGAGTSNTVAKFTGTSTVGNSSVFDDGTNPVQSPNGLTTMLNGGYEIQVPNNASTGTTLNKAVCQDGAGKAIVCPTSNPGAVIGICVQNCGTTGNAQICIQGRCAAIFDNTSVVNDWAILSTTVAGDLHDTGSTSETIGQQNVLVDGVNSGAGTAANLRFGGLDAFTVASKSPNLPKSATLLGTNSGGIAQAATTTGTGTTAVLSVSPALTGSPTAPTQAASDNSTKIASTAYVTTGISNAIAGVNPAVAVLAASTANIAGTYTSVGSGIGDTFLVTATGAFTLDGIAINTIGQRVLLKDQSTGLQNGVYTATIVGTTGVSPLFTRALDYDTPSDINSTGAIPVQSGTVNTTTSWLLTSTVNNVGTDALTYVQFSINPTKITQTIGTPGTISLPTGALASGACSSASTLAATGALTTDNVLCDFNADPTGVTGYAPSANGGLFLYKYITAGQINVKQCNNTSASITAGAATLQCRVVR